jgi:hypothetical protein
MERVVLITILNALPYLEPRQLVMVSLDIQVVQ